MSGGGKVKKTRNRVPTSCSVCRKRKIKCDKGRPHCENCILSGVTHSCLYEKQPWAKISPIGPVSSKSLEHDLLAENERLKLRIRELENATVTTGSSSSLSPRTVQSSISSGSNSFPNLFENRNIKLNNSSTTSPTDLNAIVSENEGNNGKNDVIELTNNFDRLFLKEDKMVHYGATSIMSIMSNDPYLTDMFMPYIKNLREQAEKAKNQHLFNLCGDIDNSDLKEPDLPKSNILYSTVSSAEHVIDTVEAILPPRNIFDMLMTRYFEACYTFMPLASQRPMMIEIGKIFKGAFKIKLHVESQLGFCLLAEVLVMIRMAYLSLPYDLDASIAKGSVYDASTISLCRSGYLIGPEFIEAAKLCVSQTSILKRVNLASIKCLLFLRIYRLYAPEDGDEGSESTILFGMIMQMGNSLGLNRDPSKFSLIKDDVLRHVWRKIWYDIVYLDSLQALINGSTPLIHDDSFYDTELPYVIDSVKDDEREKNIIKYYRLQNELSTILRESMNLCCDLKHPLRRSQLESQISKLSYFLQNQIKPFAFYLQPKDADITIRTVKAREFCLRLIATMAISLYYYLLFLTCNETKRELSQKFAFRAWEGALITFRIALTYVKTGYIYFGAESFIVKPTILLVTQSMLQIICSLTLRLHMNLFSCTRPPGGFVSDDARGLDEWIRSDKNNGDSGTTIYEYIEEFYAIVSKWSYKYFRFWRVGQAINIFIKYVKEKYPLLIDDGTNYGVDFSENDKLMKNPISTPDFFSNTNNAETPDINYDAVNNMDLDFFADNLWSQYLDPTGTSFFDYFSPNLNIQLPNNVDNNIGSQPTQNDNGKSTSDNEMYNLFNE